MNNKKIFIIEIISSVYRISLITKAVFLFRKFFSNYKQKSNSYTRIDTSDAKSKLSQSTHIVTHTQIVTVFWSHENVTIWRLYSISFLLLSKYRLTPRRPIWKVTLKRPIGRIRPFRWRRCLRVSKMPPMFLHKYISISIFSKFTKIQKGFAFVWSFRLSLLPTLWNESQEAFNMLDFNILDLRIFRPAELNIN